MIEKSIKNIKNDYYFDFRPLRRVFDVVLGAASAGHIRYVNLLRGYLHLKTGLIKVLI